MHKMPKIWRMYCSFLSQQTDITKTRRTFDRALKSLPITQHDRIWELYLKFARGKRKKEEGEEGKRMKGKERKKEKKKERKKLFVYHISPPSPLFSSLSPFFPPF